MIRRHIKTVIIAAVIFLFMIAVLVFKFFIDYKQYSDTHLWVNLQITNTVQTETSDAYHRTDEYLKGETHQFHTTIMKVKSIDYNDNVILTFEPAVVNDAGESIRKVKLKNSESFHFTENCNNGESASGTIQVVNFRIE